MVCIAYDITYDIALAVCAGSPAESLVLAYLLDMAYSCNTDREFCDELL